MSPTRLRRRGVTLALVVIVMAFVAGVVTVLTAYTAQIYRVRQGDRAMRVTRALLNSGVVYARSHEAAWSAQPPDKPTVLDVRALLPTGMTGGLTLSFPTRNGRSYCRVFAHAKSGRAGAADQIDIALRP